MNPQEFSLFVSLEAQQQNWHDKLLAPLTQAHWHMAS